MGENSFDIDDRLLLTRTVCHQDRKAPAILWLRYAPQVRSHIAFHVGPVADTEGLVQDVFLQIWQGKGHYDSAKGVKPYIFGIATNVIRRYQREKRRSPQTIPADSINGLFPKRDFGESNEPVERISARQWKRILARADVGLSARLREAVELRFIEKFSCEQAARRLGCSKWAFCKRIERAKKLLREALKTGL